MTQPRSQQVSAATTLSHCMHFEKKKRRRRRTCRKVINQQPQHVLFPPKKVSKNAVSRELLDHEEPTCVRACHTCLGRLSIDRGLGLFFPFSSRITIYLHFQRNSRDRSRESLCTCSGGGEFPADAPRAQDRGRGVEQRAGAC